MSGPFEECFTSTASTTSTSKLVLHDDIDSGDININPTGPNTVANKDSYEACVQDS